MTVTHLSKAVQDLLSVEALCLAGTETCSLADSEHPVLCMCIYVYIRRDKMYIIYIVSYNI